MYLDMERSSLGVGVIDPNKTYKQRTHFKPSGLWYQIGASWEAWCANEMPEWLNDYKVKHALKIDTSNILIIKNDSELIEFTNRFGVTRPGFRSRNDYILWEEVAKRYDGIEIPNYLYNMRLNNETGWYYTWDVACGCVWNLDVVSIRTEKFDADVDVGPWLF